ncbi:fk506-binding protein [Anaeramoeba flamelloides]|uniref:peptidylprolyl isomerase n=1 Tax=Anaeramoeba flamelloides TaxID=1746091 RepID=A0AAV7ZHV3_9EUKA|nr:fk506-binding protein [Anaeramoeba flamelloides]
MTSKLVELANGKIIKKVIREGSGEHPKKLSKVRIHYVNTTLDGTPFDSSRQRETPFEFEVGSKRVIDGWEIGILTMRQGEIAIFTIEPELGYGNQKIGSKIPANSTLVFEIEVLNIDNSVCLENQMLKLTELKNEGNTFFKTRKFQEAEGKYLESLESVKKIPRRTLEPEEKKQVVGLQTTLLLNASMSEIKLEKFAKSLKNCEEALKLDPKNPKAIYRKGLSYGGKLDYDEAIKVFSYGVEIDPQNKIMKSKLNFYKKKKIAEQDKKRNMYKKMLLKKK